MARRYIVSGLWDGFYDRPALPQSEYLAIEGDYRRAYGELYRAVQWMRICQRAYRVAEETIDWQASLIAEAEVDRLLR